MKKPKKYQVLTGAVLAASLGLGGVATASASSTGTSQPTPATSTASKAHGATAVCFTTHGPAKEEPAKSTVRFKDGKVYVNGRLDSRIGVGNDCPEPPPLPAPGKGGKGGIIVCAIEDGKGDGKRSGKPAKSTVRAENGKVYVNGEQVPKGKVKGDCPVKPTAPGKGEKTEEK